MQIPMTAIAMGRKGLPFRKPAKTVGDFETMTGATIRKVDAFFNP
jgi:hypothetical protein